MQIYVFVAFSGKSPKRDAEALNYDPVFNIFFLALMLPGLFFFFSCTLSSFSPHSFIIHKRYMRTLAAIANTLKWPVNSVHKNQSDLGVFIIFFDLVHVCLAHVYLLRIFARDEVIHWRLESQVKKKN